MQYAPHALHAQPANTLHHLALLLQMRYVPRVVYVVQDNFVFFVVHYQLVAVSSVLQGNSKQEPAIPCATRVMYVLQASFVLVVVDHPLVPVPHVLQEPQNQALALLHALHVQQVPSH
jgi:hypothetical protein